MLEITENHLAANIFDKSKRVNTVLDLLKCTGPAVNHLLDAILLARAGTDDFVDSLK